MGAFQVVPRGIIFVNLEIQVLDLKAFAFQLGVSKFSR